MAATSLSGESSPVAVAEITCPVAFAVEAAGGPVAAARACGVKRQAVDKWIVKGALPRTEYTGESSHAIHLASAAANNGRPFDPDWLKAACLKNRSAA